MRLIATLKRIVLGLGGKSPFVVLNDVQDYTFAASHAVSAAFWNMKENCTGNSRIIVSRNRKDEFIDAMKKQLESWKIGNPLDPANCLGSIVSEA